MSYVTPYVDIDPDQAQVMACCLSNIDSPKTKDPVNLNEVTRLSQITGNLTVYDGLSTM